MSDTNDLEWRVIQSVCIGEGEYLLILDGTEIKIMARALGNSPNKSNRYFVANQRGGVYC